MCCPLSNERVCAIKARSEILVQTICTIQRLIGENIQKGTIKPYDALHFDLSLVDKYGGFLPDEPTSYQVASNNFLQQFKHLNYADLVSNTTTINNNNRPLNSILESLYQQTSRCEAAAAAMLGVHTTNPINRVKPIGRLPCEIFAHRYNNSKISFTDKPIKALGRNSVWRAPTNQTKTATEISSSEQRNAICHPGSPAGKSGPDGDDKTMRTNRAPAGLIKGFDARLAATRYHPYQQIADLITNHQLNSIASCSSINNRFSTPAYAARANQHSNRMSDHSVSLSPAACSCNFANNIFNSGIMSPDRQAHRTRNDQNPCLCMFLPSTTIGTGPQFPANIQTDQPAQSSIADQKLTSPQKNVAIYLPTRLE